MIDDDQKHASQFDAALPLPLDGAPIPKSQSPEGPSNNPAADLIRRRIEEAYASEPSVRQEEKDIEKSNGRRLTKHQKFIFDLTNSGKPLHEIQIAWHEYYAGLPDDQKHEVWQEFYKTHAEASHFQPTHHKTAHDKARRSSPPHLTKQPTTNVARSLQNIRSSLKTSDLNGVRVRPHSPLRSLVFGLSIGMLVLVLFLFSFFNERFITPFIQPSRNISDTVLISSTVPASSSPQLIIPKINVQIPIVMAADNSDNTIEKDLESGVVHYADTAMPGQNGNLVIFGHSSNNIFNPGRYKFAFVLLKRLDSGDTFYIDYHSKRYTYEIFNKVIVPPSNVSVLDDISGKTATATLITCDPPGTSINRLVVSAAQIDPSPAHNAKALPDSGKAAREAKAIAGNGPTLWGRFTHWLWN
ncbi:MAG TPA: class D sortase [Candidatus Saccharimonadales bacterium]|nr:class D sortase [Candidatus Saccharimonadales bacterium]